MNGRHRGPLDRVARARPEAGATPLDLSEADSPHAAAGRGHPHAPTGRPVDRMMVDYLRGGAEVLHARSAEDLRSADDWLKRRPQLQEEYLYMLGLWPLPAKTPLAATIVRSRSWISPPGTTRMPSRSW